MTIDAGVVLQFIFFIVAGVVGAYILKSQLTKTQHRELEVLAQTRKEAITDLEKKVDNQARDISDLQAEVKVVRQLLATSIAKETAERVVEALQDRLK